MMMLFFFLVGGGLASFSLWFAQTYVNGTSYFRARSCCPHCGKNLCTYDMIPIFSYLLLRGKCRHCQQQISLLYLTAEVMCGLFAAAIYVCFGISPATFVLLLLLLVLFTASLVDYFVTLLPDVMILPALLIFPPLFIICGLLTIEDALLGFLIAFTITAGLRTVFFLLRKKEGLGLGDIKLFALAGALCGWQFLPLLFFMSASLALLAMAGLLVLGKVNRQMIWRYRLPFGPFIAASLLCVILLRQTATSSLFLF